MTEDQKAEDALTSDAPSGEKKIRIREYNLAFLLSKAPNSAEKLFDLRFRCLSKAFEIDWDERSDDKTFAMAERIFEFVVRPLRDPTDERIDQGPTA